MQLILSNIEYAYPAATEAVLQGVTVSFPAGWCGIVGDNGCGKTTLARIATGLIAPDAGTVSSGLVCEYCAQDSLVTPENLYDFALAFDREAVRLRRELAIDEEWTWRYETLSGGQQKRLQVACALWAAPDVLVVDEPTNHVDATTRRSITAALRRFSGIGLLISHDRELLDALCSQCLFVSNGTAVMRPGTYTQASAQATLERTSAVREREVAKRERARIEREAQRRREEAARTQSKRSARGLSRADSDAREKRARFVVSGQDGKAARLSRRMEGRLERAEARLSAARVDKRYDADVWLDVSPSRRRVLFRMEPDTIRLGETALTVPALHIQNTDHIGLVGDNGCGKTTLVGRIVARVPATTRLLYVPQEPDCGRRRSVLTALADLGPERRGRVLSIVAQLNSEPERILEGDAVSPGEMRKLMLALGIISSPELIIMDEPTNHLDLGSTEALERVLADYAGALLLVSHDAALVSASTGILWSIEREGDGFGLRIR